MNLIVVGYLGKIGRPTQTCCEAGGARRKNQQFELHALRRRTIRFYMESLIRNAAMLAAFAIITSCSEFGYSAETDLKDIKCEITKRA